MENFKFVYNPFKEKTKDIDIFYTDKKCFVKFYVDIHKGAGLYVSLLSGSFVHLRRYSTLILIKQIFVHIKLMLS